MREERLKRQWTQGQFATLTGLSEAHISLIENGKRRPGRWARQQIAKALRLSEEYLFQSEAVA